jgi:hypothetical protein
MAEEFDGSFPVSYLLAVREYASQFVPGSLNGGSAVVLGAADETTPQLITYENVPFGYSTGITAGYVPAGGAPSIALVANWSSSPAVYPAVPASIASAGGFYSFDATADGPLVSNGGSVSVQMANNGGPISVSFPPPWSYSGPTPAALPTFDYSGHAGTSGTNGVSRDAQMTWWTSNESVVNTYFMEATANAMNGGATLTMLDLSGFSGFLAPPASGTIVSWYASINQSNYQLTQAQSPGNILSQAMNGGLYKTP